MHFIKCEEEKADFSDADTSNEAIQDFLAIHEENKKKRLEKKKNG